MPPPEPRSRTVSPSRSSATAVGLPQPRLARTAASGSDCAFIAGIEGVAPFADTAGSAARLRCRLARSARRSPGRGRVPVANFVVDARGFGHRARTSS